MWVNERLHTRPIPGYRIFCDLDGVLADFDKAVQEKLGLTVPYDDAEMWPAVNKYNATGGQWFFDLDPMPHTKDYWSTIKSLYNTGRVDELKILTATGQDYERASIQKIRWCWKHLGMPPGRIITVPKSRDKAQHATPDGILIDDNLEKCIKPWRAAGGIGIHFQNPRQALTELMDILDAR